MFFSTLRQTNKELRRIAEALENLGYLLRISMGVEKPETEAGAGVGVGLGVAGHTLTGSLGTNASTSKVFYAQSEEPEETYRGQEMDALQQYWFRQGQAAGRADAVLEMEAARTAAERLRRLREGGEGDEEYPVVGGTNQQD